MNLNMAMNSAPAMARALAEAGGDFEWYPATQAMVDAVAALAFTLDNKARAGPCSPKAGQGAGASHATTNNQTGGPSVSIAASNYAQALGNHDAGAVRSLMASAQLCNPLGVDNISRTLGAYAEPFKRHVSSETALGFYRYLEQVVPQALKTRAGGGAAFLWASLLFGVAWQVETLAAFEQLTEPLEGNLRWHASDHSHRARAWVVARRWRGAGGREHEARFPIPVLQGLTSAPFLAQARRIVCLRVAAGSSPFGLVPGAWARRPGLGPWALGRVVEWLPSVEWIGRRDREAPDSLEPPEPFYRMGLYRQVRTLLRDDSVPYSA